MKKIVRLTESDLNRIVRRVMNEQAQNLPVIGTDMEGSPSKFYISGFDAEKKYIYGDTNQNATRKQIRYECKTKRLLQGNTFMQRQPCEEGSGIPLCKNLATECAKLG
jgi:hypothetical protein